MGLHLDTTSVWSTPYIMLLRIAVLGININVRLICFIIICKLVSYFDLNKVNTFLCYSLSLRYKEVRLKRITSVF